MRRILLLPACALLQAQDSAGDLMRAAVEKQRAAIETQRSAVRKQAATAGVRMAPWADHASADCDPAPDNIVAPLIEGAAKASRLEPKLIRAVIQQESGFRPCAVSAKGAQGLMQLMPATAEELGVRDPFDPKESIEGGARYLRSLLDKFKGDVAKALGAYNAGPAAADESGAIPQIPETQDYVAAILKAIGK